MNGCASESVITEIYGGIFEVDWTRIEIENGPITSTDVLSISILKQFNKIKPSFSSIYNIGFQSYWSTKKEDINISTNHHQNWINIKEKHKS